MASHEKLTGPECHFGCVVHTGSAGRVSFSCHAGYARDAGDARPECLFIFIMDLLNSFLLMRDFFTSGKYKYIQVVTEV